MPRILVISFLTVLFVGDAHASLVYEVGTVSAVYGNMLQMAGRNFKLLDNAPIRLHVKKGKSEAEVKGNRSDIRQGSIVQLHVAGHLVVDVLVERK